MADALALLVQLPQAPSSPAGKARLQFLPTLGQRDLHAHLVSGAMQIIDACRDGDALEIPPRPLADALAGIDGELPLGGLGAEIGAPRLGARPLSGWRPAPQLILGHTEHALDTTDVPHCDLCVRLFVEARVRVDRRSLDKYATNSIE